MFQNFRKVNWPEFCTNLAIKLEELPDVYDHIQTAEELDLAHDSADGNNPEVGTRDQTSPICKEVVLM